MDLIGPSKTAVTIHKEGDEVLQDAINSFRAVLTPQQLAEFDSIQSLPDTDAVLIFTAELDLRRQSQKGKSIASRLFPVLQAIHSFTGVIDTFVSSNPIIAALIWGSVRMTMQIILNAASYYEAFAELFMNLGTICPRFEQYQALFPTSTRLQVALCNFNASIIRCCQRVIKMPKISSGWTSPLNPLSPSFWQSFQQSFESNLQELRAYSKNVKEEIRLAQAASDHRSRELQKLERDEAKKSRRSLSRFMSRTRTQIDTIHRSQLVGDEQLEREKKQKLLDALSSHDYIKPLKQARQKRYPQSASWIFDTSEFRSWTEEMISPMLWCSGKMGSGKTILAASVIDFLLTKGSEQNRKVLFFFSRFDEPESMNTETALRAFARHTINTQDISGNTKAALEDIQNADQDCLGKVTQLLGLLLERKRQPTWIVIDGIDEWPRDERHKLIGALSTILTVAPGVKPFVTSRDLADIKTREAFPGLHQISMSCLEAKAGMAQLVNQAVRKCLDAEELVVTDKELIADIEKTLMDNANGMILWVALVLRDLCDQPSNEKVREAISLQNLPKGLTEVFNRALERIISHGKLYITQKVLPWIVAAKQPLSLSQLQECCLIHILQEYSVRERYVNGIQFLDTWFQGLVEVDHQTQTVHFVHSSVLQFFLAAPASPAFDDFCVNMEEADKHIGEIIVTYLNFNDFKKTLAHRRPVLPPVSPQGICKQVLRNELGWRDFSLRRRGAETADIDATIVACTQPCRGISQDPLASDHPFLLYASAYWLSHSFNFEERSCRVWDVWKTMLIEGHELAASPVSEGHHQSIDEDLTRWAISTGHYSLLYVAAGSMDRFEGFHAAMFDSVINENNVKLLSNMLKINERGPKLGPLCCTAARFGLVEVLKVLIENGVDLNDWETRNALIEAIEAGRVEVIELLLASSANPNLSTRIYRNALEPAVDLGGSKGIQVCEMLIKAGAYPNDSDAYYTGSTALEKACETGQRDILNLLLTAGANPNRICKATNMCLLGLGVEHNDIHIVETLLAFGADVNIDDASGNSPLQRASSAKSPRLDIVELLIKAGADIDGEKGLKLFRMAVERKSSEMVNLLIKEGASLNEHSNEGGDTLLELCAKQGLFKIMHILLDAGAYVVFPYYLLSQIPQGLRNGREYRKVSRRLYESRS